MKPARPPAANPSDGFRLLGDPVRWRLLRLLVRERLNVSEVTRVLGLAQSGTSRHLKLLKDGGLLTEERRGGWAWFGLAPAAPQGLDGLWAPLRARLLGAADVDGDDARLAEVLRERAERSPGWSGPRTGEPGRSWAAWSQALGRLVPPQRVLHLGCGRGALTREVARWAHTVVGVHAEPRAPTVAGRSGPGRAGRISFRRAPLDRVPLPPGSFDLVLLAQALATEKDPAAVLAEAVRLVRPEGLVLVLDLLPHGETWVRERLGHVRQGVSAEKLSSWLAGAGLEDVRVEPADRRRGDPFVVLIGSGRRPALFASTAAPDVAGGRES